MRRIATTAATLLLPLVCAAQPAEQRPTPKKDEDPKKLDQIEVQASPESERRESTASKIVINREEVTKYGDTDLLEVLKRLPGITVDRGPGGRGGSVRMRGLGAGYTQVLVNGERMPPGFTIDSISPDMIERIEIVRGATAEFSTAQAVAGTINVVLRQALSNQRRELKVGASVENDQTTVNASGQWADKSGSLGYTIPFNATRFEFLNEGFNEQRAFSPDFDLTQYFLSRRQNEGWGYNGNIAPRLSWNLGTGHTVNLDAFLFGNTFHGHFIEDNTPVLGEPPPYVSTDLRVNNRNGTFRTNGQWLKRFEGGGRIDAKVGVTAFALESDSVFVANDVIGVQTLERTVDSTIRDNGFTTLGKYSFPIVKGNSLVAGWDAAWNDRDDTRLQRDRNPSTGASQVLDEVFDTSIRRVAVYGQDEWDVTERLAVYLGLRWEGIETRSAGNTYEEITNRTSVVSPIVNLLWKLPGTQKDQVRMGIARTYKPPGIGDLVPRRFFAPNNSPVTPDFIGNPNLEPELSWGVDAGYEHYPAGGGNLSLSVYHRRVDDIIQREVTFEDGLYVSRPANIGTGSVTGLEFDAKGKLSQAWSAAPGIDLRLNLAMNRSKVDFIPGPYNRLDGQVPWNGTVGFDYRFGSKPLTIGSSYTARAGGTVQNSISQKTYRSVSRQLEAYGLWRFSPAVQLRITLQNLNAPDQVFVNQFTNAAGMTERSSIDPRFTRYSMLWELRL